MAKKGSRLTSKAEMLSIAPIFAQDMHKNMKGMQE